MSDPRQFLLSGLYGQAVKEFGKKAVRDEIDDMIYHDLADHALRAAMSLEFEDLKKLAARVVLNSGSYSAEARALATRQFS